jgi:hypothetical protein
MTPSVAVWQDAEVNAEIKITADESASGLKLKVHATGIEN